jgi:acetoin utilization deacetylase AcuC-like enzyme
MIKIAYCDIYAHPLPEGHRFPMLKYELIPLQLLHTGKILPEQLFCPSAASEEVIVATHDQKYWEQLRDLTLSYKDQRRIGFPLTAQLVNREIRIVQGTIDGAMYALAHGIAFNVAGGTHHAGTNWGEGFCLLNDQAIAANFLLNNGICKRILIVDLDVHQGNGTAEIFIDEPRVFTFSMHGDKNFPFRKEQSDLDLPLENGITGDLYLKLLEERLPALIKSFQPDFVFYLAGVDVLSSDKLGKLKLSKSDAAQRDRIVFELCKVHGLPIQVSMGGGYSTDIKDIVDAHCNTFIAGIDIFEQL